MKIEIPLKLPSLNDYIDLCRTNPYKAAKFKKDIEAQIALFLQMPKLEKPIRIDFTWIEPDYRRDPDNIASAKKFILDAMVKKGKLKNDSRKYVKGFSDSFGDGPKHKVILEITEVT